MPRCAAWLVRGVLPLGLAIGLAVPPAAAQLSLVAVAGKASSPARHAAPAAPANLPQRVVGGYFTTWDDGLDLRKVVDTTSYNVIYLAFAIGVSPSSGALQLDLPSWAASPADVKSQIAYANAHGRKVLVSVGGWFDLPGQRSGYRLDTAAKVDQLMTSMRALRSAWGFNGMDWDLEHGERTDRAGIVDASRRMRAEFGSAWIICFAPGVNLASWVGTGGILDTLGTGGWDAVGEQIYDQGLSQTSYRSLIVDRMRTLVAKYGAAKVILGNKFRPDSGTAMNDPSNGCVDIATTRAALSDLRARGTNIRGAFSWTVQSDAAVGGPWQGKNGVGGDVLAHP